MTNYIKNVIIGLYRFPNTWFNFEARHTFKDICKIRITNPISKHTSYIMYSFSNQKKYEAIMLNCFLLGTLYIDHCSYTLYILLELQDQVSFLIYLFDILNVYAMIISLLPTQQDPQYRQLSK